VLDGAAVTASSIGLTEGIILVGGLGTRLRPLTDTCPKPMLPVGGVPLVERQMRRLRDIGVHRIVLATSYRAEVFREAYGTGAGLGLDLVYSFEHEPLGTGGAIRLAGDFLSEGCEQTVVLNGDILSAHDLAAQIRQHADAGAAATLHTRNVELAEVARFGTVLTEEGRITGFLEKHPDPLTSTINAGCYVFSQSALAAIPRNRVVSVERDTFPTLISSGASVMAYDEQAYWIDVGTLETYRQADEDFSDDPVSA